MIVRLYISLTTDHYEITPWGYPPHPEDYPLEKISKLALTLNPDPNRPTMRRILEYYQ